MIGRLMGGNDMFVQYRSLIIAVAACILLVLLCARIPWYALVSGEITPLRNSTAANTANHTATENTVEVKAGGGDNNMSLTQFFPQVIQISVGESISWYNPSRVPEAHTVTFQMGSLYPTQLFLPVEVSKSGQLALPASTATNAEPIVVPGQNHSSFIIAANARAYNPVVISSNGSVTFLDWNAKYRMEGGEKYISSGWLFPKGEVPPGIKAGTTFTITFNKTGLYEYNCLFHPWMTGKVIAK
jgi:plastocyanin